MGTLRQQLVRAHEYDEAEGVLLEGGQGGLAGGKLPGEVATGEGQLGGGKG